MHHASGGFLSPQKNLFNASPAAGIVISHGASEKKEQPCVNVREVICFELLAVTKRGLSVGVNQHAAV